MITNKDISIDSENGKITLNGNKYDLGTQGEIDTAVKCVYSVMGQMGAKNLIPYPYYRQSGYSSNGMTVTYDSDGVLTINKVAGTETAYFSFVVNDQDYCFKPNTKYKLLFELENANQLTIYLKYGDTDIVLINKKSTGKYVVDFTTPQTLQGRENLAMNAAASDTETNAKVKVMIMLASDTDNTYEPYAMTNKQLTDQLATKQDTLTFDSAPTDASTNPVTSGGIYNTIGDLTQTGITGADVAAQLGALDTDKQDTLTVTDISSQLTVVETYVSEFKAYTYGKLIYLILALKPGVSDQTPVVSGLPNMRGLTGVKGVMPMFFMNAADAGSNGVCAISSGSIEYRGTTTSGTNGTVYSGMFILE